MMRTRAVRTQSNGAGGVSAAAVRICVAQLAAAAAAAATALLPPTSSSGWGWPAACACRSSSLFKASPLATLRQARMTAGRCRAVAARGRQGGIRDRLPGA